MTISELCVRRPVFTTMLITLPVVLGALAYMRMGVDLFPIALHEGWFYR